jgi:hypothetical protein
MITTPVIQSDLDQQKELLLAEHGVYGSGAKRYAAAMYFYTLGMMPTGMLEIYRRCSRCDHEDPIDLARFEGVELAEFVKRDAVKRVL